MRIILAFRKIIGLSLFACIVIFILSLFGGRSTTDLLPTLAVLPSLTWTPEALAIVATEPPGVTIIPTVVNRSGFVTITPLPGTIYPTATITDTPQPTATNTDIPLSSLDNIKSHLVFTSAPILDVYVNDDIQRVQIVFTSSNTRNVSEGQMQNILCLALPAIPAGYSLRLGGKLESGMTVTTAIINANNIALTDCGGVINWETFADEYSPINDGVSSSSDVANVTLLQPTDYYLTRTANVRSCGSSTCSKLGQVESGTKVTVYGVTDGEVVTPGNSKWYQVQYGGTLAFIYSAYLTDAAPIQAQQPIIIQQPAPQQPAPSGYTGPIPKNCTEARAMGIDQYTAAQINPSLDRDKDGKACYDDQ